MAVTFDDPKKHKRIKLRRPRLIISDKERTTKDAGDIISLPEAEARNLITLHLATENLEEHIEPIFNRPKVKPTILKSEVEELRIQVAELTGKLSMLMGKSEDPEIKRGPGRPANK